MAGGPYAPLWAKHLGFLPGACYFPIVLSYGVGVH